MLAAALIVIAPGMAAAVGDYFNGAATVTLAVHCC